MNSNKNKAFTLFELILVLLIGSIILIYTFTFQKELYETQIQNESIAILKIDLNSTKIIIERNLQDIQKKLSYYNNTLFYENNILLKNVTSFDISKDSNILTIDITIENKLSQTWEFKL